MKLGNYFISYDCDTDEAQMWIPLGTKDEIYAKQKANIIAGILRRALDKQSKDRTSKTHEPNRIREKKE